MVIPSTEQITRMRQQYPAGTRVELVSFVEPDPYSNLKPGARGTVVYVDDMANLAMKWDNGSTLNLLYEDDYKIIKEAI